MDPLKAFRDRLAKLSQLSLDDLTTLEADLVSAFDDADKSESGPDVAAMEAFAETLDKVRAEGQARADAEDAEAEEVEGEEAETEETPGQVAASAAREKVRRPSLAEIHARRPKRAEPKPSRSAGVSMSDLARRLEEGARDLAYSRRGGRVVALSARAQYPEERALRADDPGSNWGKIEQLVAAAGFGDYEALTAAGGLCAPVDVRYDVDIISSQERPLRDALVRFGAERGGLSFIAPPQLTDATGAVGVWTHANDVTPGSDGPATKPVLSIDCGSTVTEEVSAVTARIEAGNFQRRFNPEHVAAWWELALASHARLAENTLWDSIVADSTAVVTGADAATELGTARRVLRAIALTVEGLRDRHRLPDSKAIRVIAPRSLRANAREDLAAQIPGDNAMAIADAQIAEFFARRGVVVTWSLDGGGQTIGAQAAGALNPWPDTVELLVFPEGTHLFLDGGELNFGLEIRDSTLDETNDAESFTETFEETAKVGPESIALTVDTCPSGRSSAAVEYDPCSLGS